MTSTLSTRSTPSSADAIQDTGWPCRRLKEWPIAVDWKGEKQKKRVGPIGYQKVVGTVRNLFNDDALGDVLTRLHDYCFQQGGMSNANPRDRNFFFDVLTHDLVFFRGDQGHPIVEDLPIDPKVYDALPQMEASHYDVLRIHKKGLAGGLRVESVLTGEKLKAGTRIFRGPGKGDAVLGRLVQIGRSYFLDEPWLAVSEEDVEPLKEVFDRELAALKKSHGSITPASLLKVAGYHLYETAAALELRRTLSQRLPDEVGFEPVLVRYRVRKRREIPDLESLAGATVSEREGDPVKGKAVIVMIDQAPETDAHRSLRETMVSRDDKDLLVVSWIDAGRKKLLDAVESALPVNAVKATEEMELGNIYRSLRHTLTGR